jgi:hypothetical protein
VDPAQALPDPGHLEFKVDPLEAADMGVDMIGVGTQGRGAIYNNFLWVASAKKSFINHDIRFWLFQHVNAPGLTMESGLLFRCFTQSYDNENLGQK